MKPSFEEWMLQTVPDGTHKIQDEIRTLFLKIESIIIDFKNQINRQTLFFDIAREIYEQSV